jgi:hypothetical protein
MLKAKQLTKFQCINFNVKLMNRKASFFFKDKKKILKEKAKLNTTIIIYLYKSSRPSNNRL